MRSPRVFFCFFMLTVCLLIDGMLGAFPGTLLVNHSSASATISKNTDLPEPLSTSGGLITGNLEQARAHCQKEHLRLPSVAETTAWAVQHGATQLHVGNMAPKLDAEKFVYPPKRLIINAAVWTENVNVPGRYAFSLYEAKYSPVPPSAVLAIVCVTPT